MKNQFFIHLQLSFFVLATASDEWKITEMKLVVGTMHIPHNQIKRFRVWSAVMGIVYF